MKKILILTCESGGGHIATTQALSWYLHKDYHVATTNIFSNIVASVDPLNTITFGRYSSESFYNYCITKKHNKLLNSLVNLSEWYFRKRHAKMSVLIENFFLEQNPDLVISVVPLMNSPILDATHTLNIPFILVPTDLNAQTFIHDFKAPCYDKFRFTLPFEDPDIRKKIASAHIPQDQINVTGFPIRPDFFEQKNIAELKKQYKIPLDKPVMLMLMGMQGSDALYFFTKQISKISIPLHTIICIGRYNCIKDKIRKVKLPSHITLTVLDYTHKVSDIMAMADVFLTKSGSVSVCEALYMNLPMILDATNQPLAWEQFNHMFIEKHNFGTSITDYNQIPDLLSKFFSDKNYLETIQNNIKTFPKKNGGIEITNLINNMLNISHISTGFEH